MSAPLNLTGSIVVPLRAAADDAPLFNLTDPRPSGEVDLTASVVVLVVIAGLPLQLWLIHCLWLSRRPSQACGWDMSERRSRDEAQLLERLSSARRVEQQVRARVTFGSLAVAWACEIVAWGPLTVSWATGVSEADFYARSGIPLPVYGIPAALGPALVLLACRPLDHIGVRLAGAFCGASYLYYFVIDILDCLEDDWPAAAASGWAPLETVLLALQLFGIFAASLGSASGFFAASLSRATRDALRRHWIVLRTSYALGAASWGTQYVVLLALGRPVSPYLALSAYCDCIGTLIFTLFFTERTRGCIHRALGWSGLSESFRSLAAVASLIGCGGATSVMERRCRDAIGSFRGLPWSKLTAGDLAAEGAEEGCDGRRSEDETVPAAMGEVDAFISHSWSDDGREKHEALQGWAEAFEASNGRSPIVWLDRCCIRQDEDIAASLLGLPVYLSGCRSLLVLYGASYCGRLWCVMEVFCFLAMGGKLDAIQVLLLPSSSAARAGSSYASVGEPGKGKGAAWTLRRGLAKFRLSEATCTMPGDRTRMLAVIECAFGDDVPFNRIVRSLLSGLSHRHASCTSRGTTFRSISRGGHGGSLVSVAEPSGPSGRASADAEGVACKV